VQVDGKHSNSRKSAGLPAIFEALQLD